MTTIAAIPVSNASIKNVVFTEAKRNKQGGMGVSMKYDNQNLMLRLPCLSFPGGLITREDEKTGTMSYSIIGTLKGCDPYGRERSTNTDDVSNMYNFLCDLKEKLIQTATENSSKWFGKTRSADSVRDSFNDRSILCISADKVGNEYIPNGKYPPSFKMKLPVYDGSIKMDIVDSSSKDIYLTLDNLRSVFPKGVRANLAVSGSIYIIGQSYGIAWRVSHGQVLPQTRLTAALMFAPVEDAEDNEHEEQQEEQAVEETTEQVQVEVVPPPSGRKRRVAVPA
jgi:hypothetical protein